jgi:hypothetical protein
MDSGDRELWVKIGMALKTIGNQGRSLWLAWSATSDSFDPLNDAKTWDGFKPERANYKLVFSEAQKLGWINHNKRHVDIEPSNIEEEAQDWKPNLAGEIDYLIPFDGIAKHIQEWILSTSMYPQPAIAFAATMSVLAVTIGRSIRIENIKGNLMYIAMAESGEGKDWPFKAAKKIIDAIGLSDRVCKKAASGAALMEALSESPSLLFHIDEFGNYLSSINGKNSNQYSKEIVDIITEAYTSADGELTGKRTKGNEPIRVIEPNLCVMGLSTERQVFDGLRTSDIANGSLARYSMLFGDNGMLPRRVNYKSHEVPGYIVDGLKELMTLYEKPFFLSSQQLSISKQYDDEKFNLSYRTKEMINRLKGNDKSFIPMYNRIAFRSVQQAMLIDRCTDIDVLLWLEKLELASVNIFAKKFMHLGADNEDERLAKLLQAKIKEAGKNGILASSLTRSTQQIKTSVRKQMIEELLAHGIIGEAKSSTGGQRPSTLYYWKK